MLGILDKMEYNCMIDTINKLYKGWDTCPMIYFDKEKIASHISIPANEVPVLMITIGKTDTSSDKIRGFRKPLGEFVEFI